jgi:hypothetical protein
VKKNIILPKAIGSDQLEVRFPRSNRFIPFSFYFMIFEGFLSPKNQKAPKIQNWKRLREEDRKPTQERQIKCCGPLACNHKFEVKSYYYTLQSGGSSIFPWKSIWKVKAPPRIAFFTWKIALGKLLTIDNLQRQVLTLVNCCFLCKMSAETVNHLSFIVSLLVRYNT